MSTTFDIFTGIIYILGSFLITYFVLTIPVVMIAEIVYNFMNVIAVLDSFVANAIGSSIDITWIISVKTGSQRSDITMWGRAELRTSS